MIKGNTGSSPGGAMAPHLKNNREGLFFNTCSFGKCGALNNYERGLYDKV